jgi:hypothetical protein
MFEKKLKPEPVTKAKTTATAQTQIRNAFVAKAKAETSITRSGNGAKKYKSSGNTLVDQFTKSGTFKAPRNFNAIVSDAELLYGEDPLNAVKFNLFLRTIPRIVSLPDGTKTQTPQKGSELKHEAIMRMIWLGMKNPEAFWKNILLFVSVGSWHDVFTMLQYDLVYNGWNDRKLDWEKFGDLILAALQNTNTSDLVKKYLPQIKAKSACRSIESQANNQIAKWICSLLFGAKESASSYKQYRKLKSSGTAHTWQQLISQKRFDKIDFNSIHGRALSILVRGKFLKNQGLSEKYTAWITKPETKDVKYTGFVHELLAPLGRYRSAISVPVNERETINKQFATLVEKAKTGNEQTKFIVVRDTSGSMGSSCAGTNMTCYDVAKALALYFSEFLTGPFADNWIEFNRTAIMHDWVGKTPIDKWYNDGSSFVGTTNFQSVIDLFVNLKRQGISEEDFPTGFIAISDGEFNPSELGKTNVETARKKLRNAGFSKEYCENFVIVLWNLQSNAYGRGTGEKFETGEDTQGVFYYGGFSASTISFLTGKIKNTYELMEEALSQEILQMVEI